MLLVGLGYGLRALTVERASGGARTLPACPQPFYSADGNLSPLFCRIDNPLALRFYEPTVGHLVALGHNATPDQVYGSLTRSRLTAPEMCSAYELAAWAEHWRFGIDPVPGPGCS